MAEHADAPHAVMIIGFRYMMWETLLEAVYLQHGPVSSVRRTLMIHIEPSMLA